MGLLVQEGALTGSIMAARLLVDASTGKIYYKIESLKRRGQFDLAGYIKPGTRASGGGYRMIPMRLSHRRSKAYRAHHIVWAWHYGVWPDDEIDHKNGNRDDNRISNLRESTSSQNKANRPKQSNNSSGFKWVYRCQTGFWRADVAYREDGVKKRFRVYGQKTPDAAYEIASNFARSVHGKFYNPGKK